MSTDRGDRDLYVHPGGKVRYARSETAELNRAIAAVVAGETATAVRLLKRLRDQSASGMHRNPPLIVFGNPPLKVGAHPVRFEGGKVVGQLSAEAHAILYRHIEDGKPYRHDFETPVDIFAIERAGHRDILLTSPDGEPIWGDF